MSRSTVALALPLLAVLALVSGPARAAQPWDEPFAASAEDLLKAGKGLPTEDADSAAVLLEEGRYVFDEKGRITRTYRLVYQVRSQDGVEDWSEVETDWAPFHQAKPEIRARVIEPDGSEHQLDPSTIDDSPASEEPDLYDDARVLRAPLPHVVVGALVEQETTTHDESPLFDAASMGTFYFGQSQRVEVVRLVVDAPSSLPVKWVARGLAGLEPRREEHDGRVRLVFERTGVAPWEMHGRWLPADVVTWPHVSFTTGRSWADVARRYAETVDAAADVEAVRDMAKQAAGDAKEPRIVAARCLDLLRKKLRYTGIEFGTSAIVPVSPKQALRRGYGDCKDQATFLVAMLRSLSVPASVALLEPGPGEDVDPDMPGVGDFGHAIAHVDVDPPLWIDTTDPYTPVGELPSEDQDRLALVASKATTGLSRTPLSTSKDNRVVEDVDVTLAETGPAKVQERTEAFGVFGSEYRANYDGAKPAEIEKTLKAYANHAYLADAVADVTHSDGSLLEAPYLISFTAPKARRGLTDVRQAAAALVAAPVVARLGDIVGLGRHPGPGELGDEGDEGDEEGDGSDEEADEGSADSGDAAPSGNGAATSAGNPRSPRTEDYVIPEAFSWERRYRVVPPPGFVVRNIPEPSTRSLGPATLVTQASAGEGGVVTVAYRFDTVKRRFTPAEWEVLRAGVEDVLDAKPDLVVYDQVGERELADGHVKEALAEFRSLERLHPAEALHHVQVARALLAVGLGDAARAEGRGAIAIEPTSGMAHRVYGFVLEHDALGRRFGGGADVEGAVREMRRALEIDAKDGIARAELAALLERDARGHLLWEGPRLKEAIDQYRTLRADEADDEHQHDEALILALLRSRDWSGVRDVAKDAQQDGPRDAAWLAAIAAQDGADAAIAASLRPPFDAAVRRDLLAAAGGRLAQLRLYPAAATLLDEAAKGTSGVAEIQERADLFRKVRPLEQVLLPEEDPRSVLQRMLVAVFHGDSEAFVELLAAPLRADAKATEALERQATPKASQRDDDDAPGSALVLDVALSAGQITRDGDDAVGWRIGMNAGALGSGIDEELFLVKEGDRWRIAGLETWPGSLGAQALRFARAGDVAAARRWLDWARDRVKPGNGDDPLPTEPFVRTWHKGQDASPAQVELAAAMLATTGDEAATRDAVAILRAARDGVSGDAARDDVDVAILRGLIHLDRHDEAAKLARVLAAAHPDSQLAFEQLLAALVRLDAWDEAVATARARVAARPDESGARRTLADLLAGRGNLDEARAIYRALIDSGESAANDYNQLAWMALFSGAPLDEAQEEAQRAVSMTHGGRAAFLHTLASVLAEGGKAPAAHEVILKAIDVAGREEPESSDWYVLGRIAEEYGERDAAIAAYRKVELGPDEKATEALSCFTLAQRRLQGLGSAAAKR